MSSADIFSERKRDRKARLDSAKWILGHLARHRLMFIVMLLSLVFTIILRSAIPILIGILIDEAILPQELDVLIFLAAVILAIGVSRVIIEYISIFVSNTLSWRAIRDIRIEFFETLQDKPLRFHDRVRSGDLMALATNDMNQLGFMVNPGLRLLANAFLSIIIVIVYSLNFELSLTLALIPFFIAYIWGIQIYNKKMNPISSTFMHKWSNISTSAQDAITGVRVVRAFNGEEYEKEQFRKVVEEFRDTWDVRQMIIAKYWPLLVLNLTIGFSLFYSTWLVLQGALTLGELVGLNGMLILLIEPTFIISFAVLMFQGGLAGGERIFHVLRTEKAEEARTIDKTAWPNEVKGTISFNDVNFRYEGTEKYVLKDFSLEIQPGETVALVGPTGSGKTTLTKLLLRFYDYEGKISIDGIDIKDFKLRDLRQNIGRVEQDVFIFASSVRENLIFGMGNGCEIPQSEIEHAAQMAQAHDFIMEQKEGYDTIVGERGVGLSGGQRQRISIARCLLTDPRILIFDDSTSAIDSETEEQIAEAMDQVMKDRTSFLITHRLSAIRKADKIVVLKEGMIKATGKHEELLRTSEDYRRIFGKQLKLPKIKAIPTPAQKVTSLSSGGAD